MSSKIEACKKAKDSGRIGALLSVIGALMYIAILIMFILIFTVPAWAALIFSFLIVWGWVLGIIGAILLISGHLLRRRERITCSIV